MRTTCSIWTGLAFLVVVLALCAPTSALTVNVRIIDHQGMPIADCGFFVRYENREAPTDPLASGVTGPDGLGAVELPAPTAIERVEAWISIKATGADASWDAKREAIQKYYDLASDHRWPRYVRVAVEPDQDTVELVFPCARAIAVGFRLLDSQGSPIEAGDVRLYRGPIPVGTATSRDGTGQVLGVLPGESIPLLIAGTDDATTFYLELPAHEVDADLGDITVPELVKDATVQLALDATDWEHEDGEQYTFAGVTLIRSDGSYLLTFLANAQGQIVTNFQGSDTTLPVPAGTYYLLPGGFLDRPIDLRAFDLVRSAQTHLVPDWPTITVAPGETATATVHAAALDAAIRATMPAE